MKLLVLAPDYPKPGRLFGGIFAERSVAALKELCDGVEVLAPRPYAPRLLSSLVPRWRIHASTPAYEIRNDVPVYRPAVPVVPRIGGAFWVDKGAFIWCRQTARKMHSRKKFDAVLSFDLIAGGGLAWRIARDLGIPASGWGTGNIFDPASSPLARVAIRALIQLDLIFYQNRELLNQAARLLGVPVNQMCHERHIVLPRGIPDPPPLDRIGERQRRRAELGMGEEQVLVLYVGRIMCDKGIPELLEAFSLAAARDPRLFCVLLGSSPAHDDTDLIKERLHKNPELERKVRILPVCTPEVVWHYLCAADLFAFASHHEGMPNSLLEAMVMGLPTVAFGIPPVLELEAGLGSPCLVPPFDSRLFGEVILRLANSPAERHRIGQIGSARVRDHYMTRKNMSLALTRLSELTRSNKPSRSINMKQAVSVEQIP